MVPVPTVAHCRASPRATPTQNAGGDPKKPRPAGMLPLTSARASGRLVPSVTGQEFTASAWEHGPDPSPHHSPGPRETTAACGTADAPRRSPAERQGKAQNHRSPRLCRRIPSEAGPARDVQPPSGRSVVSHLNDPNSSDAQPRGGGRGDNAAISGSGRNGNVRAELRADGGRCRQRLPIMTPMGQT